MGFFEILMIAVVAIIFLGPEKLPKALVDVAKFFKAVKKTMDEAKDSIEREVNLNKIKEEALAYKNSLTQDVQTLSKDLELKELNLDFNKDDLLSQDSTTPIHHPKTPQTPTTQDLKDSTSQNPHSNPLLKREIIPNKSKPTALNFGTNLAPSPNQENIESQTTRNENV